MCLRNTGRGILDQKEMLIPSLSLLESETLLTQASTEILLSLSKQLNVTCRMLTTYEARTFVEHVTCTYGPLRNKTWFIPLCSHALCTVRDPYVLCTCVVCTLYVLCTYLGLYQHPSLLTLQSSINLNPTWSLLIIVTLDHVISSWFKLIELNWIRLD